MRLPSTRITSERGICPRSEFGYGLSIHGDAAFSDDLLRLSTRSNAGVSEDLLKTFLHRKSVPDFLCELSEGGEPSNWSAGQPVSG